jgi:hypothetical protein
MITENKPTKTKPSFLKVRNSKFNRVAIVHPSSGIRANTIELLVKMILSIHFRSTCIQWEKIFNGKKNIQSKTRMNYPVDSFFFSTHHK